MNKKFYPVALIFVVSVAVLSFVVGWASPAELKKYIADKCKQDGVDYNPGPFYSDSLLIKYAPDKRYQLRDFNAWLSSRGLDFVEFSSRTVSILIREHFRSYMRDTREFYIRGSLENVGHPNCDFFVETLQPYSRRLFALRRNGLAEGKCIALEMIENESDLKSKLVFSRDRYIEEGLVDLPWKDLTIKKEDEVLAQYKYLGFCFSGFRKGRGCNSGPIGYVKCDNLGDVSQKTTQISSRSVLSVVPENRKRMPAISKVTKYEGVIGPASLRPTEAPTEVRYPTDGAIKNMITGIELNGFAKFDSPNKVELIGRGGVQKLQLEIPALAHNYFRDIVSPVKTRGGYLLTLGPASLPKYPQKHPLLLVEVNDAGEIESVSSIPLPQQLGGWRVPYYQVFEPIEIIENRLYLNIINRVAESDRGMLHRFEIVADFDFEYD